MPKKTDLLIAAAAVILISATGAHAYYETWDGWWNSAILVYNSTNYYYTSDEGYAHDSTYSVSRDTGYSDVDSVALYFFKESLFGPPDDTIMVILHEAGTAGGKDTGTSGTKDGEGEWDADGYDSRNGNWVKIFDIWGDWSAEFYYGPSTPTYSGTAWETGSSPSGITLDAESYGERIYFSTTTPP